MGEQNTVTKDMAKDTGMAAALIYLGILWFVFGHKTLLGPTILLFIVMAIPMIFAKPFHWLIPQLEARDMGKNVGIVAVHVWLGYLYVTKETPTLGPLAVLLLTLTFPSLFKLPARVWFGFSHMLGSVMTRVLLTVLYAVLVIPMAFLLRIAGKDAMRLKAWRNGEPSAFEVRDITFKAADLERPF